MRSQVQSRDNLQMRIIVNAVTGSEGKIICKWKKVRMQSQVQSRDNLQMGKIANAVTSIEQEIIYKCEKKEMRSQVQRRDNLQMGKIANAVPRTAVGGRYRGKRNSTLTKTYKRHLLTIMAGMGMFKRKSRRRAEKVQKEEAERYVSMYSSH